MKKNLPVTVKNEDKSLSNTTRTEKNLDPCSWYERCLQGGAEETLRRALALRHMELPVGDFIRDALASEIPAASRPLLESNIQDEIKHDIALGYIADAWGVDTKAEAEALRLRDAWTEHPDHTVLKAMVAERAIFFVLLPFFRFNGDAACRTVSADISRDEQVHVSGIRWFVEAWPRNLAVFGQASEGDNQLGHATVR